MDIETNVHARKQILSVLLGHGLSFFCRISRIIHTFLPTPHKLKNLAVAEIHSNTLQTVKHGFLDCVVLVVLASHVIFQDCE
jgi:hypothetical protein